MMPVGMVSVTARIAEIQQRFAVVQPFPGVPAATAAPADAPATGVAPLLAPPGQAAAPAADAFSSAAAPTGGAGGTGRTTSAWASRLPAAGQMWVPAIEHAAERAGIDPRLLAAVVQQESGFRADARSHAGAIGLGQLMPGTARELGVDPMHPIQNLDGAARYLRAQLDRFGSVDLALAAYNAGPGRVAKAGGVPRIHETQQYVQRVSAHYNQLRSA